jgi:hypothetical protein
MIGKMEFEMPLHQGGWLCGPSGAQPAPSLFLKSDQRSTVIPAGFSGFSSTRCSNDGTPVRLPIL